MHSTVLAQWRFHFGHFKFNRSCYLSPIHTGNADETLCRFQSRRRCERTRRQSWPSLQFPVLLVTSDDIMTSLLKKLSISIKIHVVKPLCLVSKLSTESVGSRRELVASDGVLEDISLASRSLRTHFQVLGLGLVKFSMTHRCTDTTSKSKKVLMIRAKTVISISSFPYWQDVTTLLMRFCHKHGVPARALWHDVPPQGKVAMAQTFGFMLYALGLGICALDSITASCEFCSHRRRRRDATRLDSCVALASVTSPTP